MQERDVRAVHGFVALLALLALLFGSIAGGIAGLSQSIGWLAAGSVGGAILAIFGLSGFLIVNPNEAKVLQFFGSYVGTVKAPGPRWTNPFYSKRTVSLRI